MLLCENWRVSLALEDMACLPTGLIEAYSTVQAISFARRNTYTRSKERRYSFLMKYVRSCKSYHCTKPTYQTSYITETIFRSMSEGQLGRSVAGFFFKSSWSRYAPQCLFGFKKLKLDRGRVRCAHSYSLIEISPLYQQVRFYHAPHWC